MKPCPDGIQMPCTRGHIRGGAVAHIVCSITGNSRKPPWLSTSFLCQYASSKPNKKAPPRNTCPSEIKNASLPQMLEIGVVPDPLQHSEHTAVYAGAWSVIQCNSVNATVMAYSLKRRLNSLTRVYWFDGWVVLVTTTAGGSVRAES